MKLNILILSLLAIVPLSGCNKIDPKPTANIATTPVSSSSERFRFFRDRKYGYIDRNGNMVILARFEEARDFSEGLATVKIGDKYGCIDSNGRVVIPPRFDFIGEFKNGFAEIRFDRLETGKIDRTGKILIAPSSPMLTFRNRKYGYVNRNGNIVIPARFEEATDFNEGLATVKIGDKYGCIDSSGKVVISPRFDFIGKFKNGLAEITLDRLERGKIDRTGKIVIAPSSRMLTSGGEDDNGKYIYEDGYRKMVIPAQFDFAADSFVEDMAWVAVKGRIGYINNKGKTIVSPQFDYQGGDGTGNFDSGWARVCLQSKCGYIDKTGKIVIPLKFDDAAQKFRDGLAWVKIGERLGFIDKTGKVVIPARYLYNEPHKAGMEMNNNFDRGLAKVTIHNKCLFGLEDCYEGAYIDTTGKLVFKF